MEHKFTPKIREILTRHYPKNADEVFEKSHLIQYLNKKTKSASRGSKARGSFANLYAIYVLVEDYINKGYLDSENDYSDSEGAVYTEIFTRMRQLPFAKKLQNHALNSRMNEEFRKFFPDVSHLPIIRDLKTKRYWINQNILNIGLKEGVVNISNTVIDIVNAYVEAKRSAFDNFISYTTKLAQISVDEAEKAIAFINQQIQPNVDARIFEIVSYAILKSHYFDKVIYWGWEPEELNQDKLILYKTGRTNANDGGIDFVMKPLGRFFQVTETLDFNKYFLDIDKIQRYPITFVIKTEMDEDEIYRHMEENAVATYSIKAVVKRYMESIEEIINTQKLRQIFEEQVRLGKVKNIMDEIVIQSRVEFNYE